jgi:hypothetical protein
VAVTVRDRGVSLSVIFTCGMNSCPVGHDLCPQVRVGGVAVTVRDRGVSLSVIFNCGMNSCPGGHNLCPQVKGGGVRETESGDTLEIGA